MNTNDPHKPIDADTPDTLPEPDAFERAWMSRLAESEPDLEDSADAFVASVLAKHDAVEAPPAVVGRIGLTKWLPLAAAVALAAVVGWYVMQDNTADTDGPDLADATPEMPEPEIVDPQPGDDKPVSPVDRDKLRLGQLIAQTQSTMTPSPSSLTAAMRDTPQKLRVDRLLDLVDSPVPDLKRLLEPLKRDDQQSRA